MNFNVYLDDETAQRLDAMARATRDTRNAIVRRAVAAWLEQKNRDWPEVVRHFAGDPAFKPFEATRAQLERGDRDPFAATPPSRTSRRPSRRRRG